MSDIPDWYKPLTEWNSICCREFLGWLEEYKKENPNLTIEEALTGFRALMDVGYGDEVITYKGKDRYAFGWTDPRAGFGK